MIPISFYMRITSNSRMIKTMINITMHHDEYVSVSAKTYMHQLRSDAELQTDLTFVLPYEFFHPLIRSCQSIVRGVNPCREIIQHPYTYSRQHREHSCHRGKGVAYSFCTITSCPIRPACCANVVSVLDIRYTAVSCCCSII